MISISFGSPVPDAAKLLIPATAERFHANIVPAVELVGRYVKVVLLHIAGGVSELVKTGVGFTVTVTFWLFVQPFAVKV